jgi:hypothetical protein
MASVAPTNSSAGDSSSTVRSVLSLLIFIHFFCVAVVLGSTFRRSALQSRLVSIFGPYTEFLHLDPGNATPFFHTLGRDSDDDAFIAVDLYEKFELPAAEQKLVQTVMLPENGSRWLDSRRRGLTLAKRMAVYADPEIGSDDLAGEIAQAVGKRVMLETGNRRAVVRCVRHLSQPLDLTRLFSNFPRDNPFAPEYQQTLYAADVGIDEDNEVSTQRRVAGAESAPRRTTPKNNQRPQPPNSGTNPMPPAATMPSTPPASP